MLYVKNEEKVFVHRSRRIRSKVLYYADNAVLIMRSNAQIFKALTGSRRVCFAVFIIIIIFFGFSIFESNQHSDGIGCEDDSEG
jgi:hypothetical protein